MEFNFDIDRVDTIIKQAADTIARPYFRKLAKDDIREKNPGDLVTIADEKTEDFLIEHLMALFPEATIVGEETMAKDATIGKRIQEDEWVWIIDPIDGTANYAVGDPRFAIIVALLHKGETVAGWIYDVVQDQLFHCIKGKGVWKDGAPCQKFEKHKPVNKMIGFTRPEFFPKREHVQMFENIKHFQGTTYHKAASHDYLGLVTGKGDFAVYHKIKPWDHAAGCLMVEELGGRACRLQGKKTYYPDAFLDPKARGLLIANSPDNWDLVYETMFKGISTYK